MIDLDAAEKLAMHWIEPSPGDVVTRETAVNEEVLALDVVALIAEVRQLRAKLADAHDQIDACCERCLDKCPHAPREQP